MNLPKGIAHLKDIILSLSKGIVCPKDAIVSYKDSIAHLEDVIVSHYDTITLPKDAIVPYEDTIAWPIHANVPYKDNVAPYEHTIPCLSKGIPLPWYIILSLSKNISGLSKGIPQVKTLFTSLDLYISIDSWLFQLNKNNLLKNQSLSIIDFSKIELNNKTLF